MHRSQLDCLVFSSCDSDSEDCVMTEYTTPSSRRTGPEEEDDCVMTGFNLARLVGDYEQEECFITGLNNFHEGAVAAQLLARDAAIEAMREREMKRALAFVPHTPLKSAPALAPCTPLKRSDLPLPPSPATFSPVLMPQLTPLYVPAVPIVQSVPLTFSSLASLEGQTTKRNGTVHVVARGREDGSVTHDFTVEGMDRFTCRHLRTALESALAPVVKERFAGLACLCVSRNDWIISCPGLTAEDAGGLRHLANLYLSHEVPRTSVRAHREQEQEQGDQEDHPM